MIFAPRKMQLGNFQLLAGLWISSKSKVIFTLLELQSSDQCYMQALNGGQLFWSCLVVFISMFCKTVEYFIGICGL